MTEAPISKSEREDLQRLIRQREKVLKSAAKQRSSELLADFENQMGSEFSFDDDKVWEQAAKEAATEITKAQQKIAVRCRELGIPERFAPTLNIRWSNRGYDNMVAQRRAELRNMAIKEIEAMERKAFTQVELSCLNAQTELAVAGLTSQTARTFVAALPAVDSLMPALSYSEIAGETDPPIAEQLVTPNALRQRRHRERQKKALCNGQPALCNGIEETAQPADEAKAEAAD